MLKSWCLGVGAAASVAIACAQDAVIPEAGGQPTPAESPEATDAPALGSRPGVYPVSRLRIVAEPEGAALVHDVIQNATVTLVERDGVWSSAPEGEGTVMTLREIGPGGAMLLDAASIRAVLQSVRDHTAERDGLLGHLVVPSSLDWRGDLTDLRDDASEPFEITIMAARIGDVTVRATDHRGEPMSRPRSGELSLRQGLPRSGVLHRGALDGAVYRARRHPGRTAEAVISPGDEQGVVGVELQLRDAKPWRAFYQLENTGTSSTEEIRHRFGYRHTNLTGRDDRLNVDYTTAGFSESNYAGISYDFGLPNDRWRINTSVQLSDYEASDVGATGLSFSGTDVTLRAEARYEAYQRGSLFVDLTGALVFEHSEVDNELAGTDGSESWLYPSLGLNVESIESLRSFGGDAEVLLGFLNLLGADDAGAAELGRTDAESDFIVARGSGFAQFWLEPFFRSDFGRELEPDDMTLAHELVFTGRWQVSGSRLIPTQQAVAGGLYTVRGYDEAFIAGDQMVLASAEYRYHFGRAGGLAMPGDAGSGRFQTRRTAPYGSADWDVIAKGFVDVGYVGSVDRASFENNDVLASIGFGAEVRLRSNVSARFDWGFVLTETSNGFETTDVGDNRVSFAINIAY